MIRTGWIESVAKTARVKQPCDTHARRNVRRLKMSHARVLSCNENSWRGCRRVHRGGWSRERGGRDVLCLSPWLPDPQCTFGDFPKGGGRNPACTVRCISPLVSVWPAAPPAYICSARFLLPHQRVGVGGSRRCECALACLRECLCA